MKGPRPRAVTKEKRGTPAPAGRLQVVATASFVTAARGQRRRQVGGKTQTQTEAAVQPGQVRCRRTHTGGQHGDVRAAPASGARCVGRADQGTRALSGMFCALIGVLVAHVYAFLNLERVRFSLCDRLPQKCQQILLGCLGAAGWHPHCCSGTQTRMVM